MDLQTLQDMPPWEWPEDAGTMFLGFIRNAQADASDRLLAAELAGDVTILNDELAAALLAVVRSSAETAELRGTAVISLGPVLEYADTMGFEEAEEGGLSEVAFHRIQQSLCDLFLDAEVPQEVRRQILEASVRAPQAWHQDAVRAAYDNDDAAWRRTAVFCMRFVRGFEAQILAALDSADPDIHYDAVCAAGTWEVDAAWSHVAALVTAAQTDKPLRLAAIEAAANIRPHEAPGMLGAFTASDDEDIAEAAFEALAMAEGLSAYDAPDDNDDDDV